MFIAHLKNLRNYCIKSRQVNNEFGRLFDLMVTDNLQETLPPEPLQFCCPKKEMNVSNQDLDEIHMNNRIGMAISNKQNFSGISNER